MEPAKLGKIIKEITAKYTDDGQGINILASPDEFKSTYQILLELSKVWDDLTDTESAYLLEKIAGKHRATALQSILSNEETLIRAYETALNSSGSAMEEFEKRTESVEYHLNQLKATWQEVASDTVTVEFINSVLDAAKAALEFANNIGILKIAFTGVGAIFSLFANTKIVPYFEAQGKAIGEVQESVSLFGREFMVSGEKATKASTTIGGAIKTIGLSLKSISSALALTVVLSVLTAIGSKIKEIYDEHKHKVGNLTSSINDLTSDISSLEEEYDNLNSKTNKTAGEEDKLELLREEIKLKKEQLELEKKQKADAVNNAATDYFRAGVEIGQSTDFSEKMWEAEDAFDEYDKAIEKQNAFKETLKEAKKELANYEEGTWLYNTALGQVNNAQDNYNASVIAADAAQTAANKSLQTILPLREDLVYAVENATEATREEAQANLDAFDAFVEERKIRLGLIDTVETLSEKILESANRVDLLSYSLEKANRTHTLTQEELDKLKTEYPELAEEIIKHSKKTAEGYELEEAAINALTNAMSVFKGNSLEAQLKITEAAKDASLRRIGIYKSEIAVLQTLLSATSGIYSNITSGDAGLVSPMQKFNAEQYAFQKEFDKTKVGPYADNHAGAIGYYEKQIADKQLAIEKEQKSLEESNKAIAELEEKIKNTGNGDPGSGGSSSSGSSSKSADIWDEYAHALAKANDEIERYNKVVEITQGKLDLNQSTENRTVELLAEEVQLYDELIASTKAKYKVVNDTLWAQQQGLQKMYTEAAKYMGLDADAVANMTDADLEAYIELKLDEDKANDQKIAHLLNGIIDMRENVHGLHLDWLDMKAEIKELEREEINIRINLQADLEEKFDASREGAKKVLDILEEMEGTETQRAEILGQMAESYESEINSNMQLYAENSERLLEMAKAGNTESDEYNDLLEHANEIQLRNLDLIKEQLDTRLKQIEAEKELAVRQLETQVYGEQGQDAWEKSRENEIDRLQNQLDALDEDTSEADYLEELEEKEETIRKLEEKLANLQRERTVKQLKQEEDGSWQWEYVVDDRAIAETQAELDDARADLQKTKDDKALEDQKDAIQNRIDAIEQEIEDKNDYYTMEMERLEEHYAKKKELEEQAAQDQIDTLNKQTQDVVNALNELEQKTGDGLDEVARETDKGMETIADTYSAWCTTIKTQISSWVEEVIREFNRLEAARRAAQEEAASMAPSVASVDGSHANGLKFVESNNYIARLHYGERVLTRQEAAQYNELEEDIKSGKLEAYFNSLREDTAMSFSDAATASVMRTTSMPTTNSNTTSFVIEHLELPEVKDPTDFAMVIDNWARGEFGGMAQRARIVKAK